MAARKRKSTGWIPLTKLTKYRSRIFKSVFIHILREGKERGCREKTGGMKFLREREEKERERGEKEREREG